MGYAVSTAEADAIVFAQGDLCVAASQKDARSPLRVRAPFRTFDPLMACQIGHYLWCARNVERFEVACVSLETGDVVWRRRMPRHIDSVRFSSRLDMVFVVSDWTYMLDPRTGMERGQARECSGVWVGQHGHVAASGPRKRGWLSAQGKLESPWEARLSSWIHCAVPCEREIFWILDDGSLIRQQFDGPTTIEDKLDHISSSTARGTVEGADCLLWWPNTELDVNRVVRYRLAEKWADSMRLPMIDGYEYYGATVTRDGRYAATSTGHFVSLDDLRIIPVCEHALPVGGR